MEEIVGKIKKGRKILDTGFLQISCPKVQQSGWCLSFLIYAAAVFENLKYAFIFRNLIFLVVCPHGSEVW